MPSALGGGVAPKHPDQLRRRNIPPGFTQLPAGGYQGPIPDWPMDESTTKELARWKMLWRSPQAAAWIKMEIGIVLTVARYVRNCIAVEHEEPGAKTTVAGVNLHSEVRQQEDRLGLSPLSMLRLRWEVVEDEVKAERERAPRRLRAVDTDKDA